MNSINHNDGIKCEICFEKRPTCIPLMTCAHTHTFCEECIKKWLAEGHPTCPKCRANLPLKYYMKKTNQQNVNIINASLTRNYRQSSTIQNIQPLPTSSNCFMENILTCCSIGLLLAFIIYPTIK